MFGFLGWASLLLPAYLFIEALQVWWPRSFLNRPFRYAAQFFILLATASLLYLFWQVPADTLDNASGGIIGFELGKSLSQILTIYGAQLYFYLIMELFQPKGSVVIKEFPSCCTSWVFRLRLMRRH